LFVSTPPLFFLLLLQKGTSMAAPIIFLRLFCSPWNNHHFNITSSILVSYWTLAYAILFLVLYFFFGLTSTIVVQDPFCFKDFPKTQGASFDTTFCIQDSPWHLHAHAFNRASLNT
jgi:hypothetical protein